MPTPYLNSIILKNNKKMFVNRWFDGLLFFLIDGIANAMVKILSIIQKDSEGAKAQYSKNQEK